MKRFLWLFLLIVLFGDADAQAATDWNESPQLTSGSDSSFSFSWWGRSGRTYFIQQSSSLAADWNDLPIIVSGSGALINYSFASSAPNLFLRLRYTDSSAQLAPVFSVSGGIYAQAQSIALTTPIPYAEIHYTTNGQTPTLSDPVVANGGTISLGQTTVLKACAFVTSGTFSWSSPVISGTYYLFTDPKTKWVDARAATGGTGSFQKPYQTISAAVAASTTSSIIVVRSGTYNEQVSLSKSGTTGAPYTLQGAPGERIIISGMQPLSGWTLYSGSVYMVSTGTWSPDTFYVGMNQRLMAQSPNVGTGYWAWQAKTVDSSSNTVITDTSHLVGIGDLTGGYIQTYATDNISITGRPILSNDPVAGTLTFYGNFATPATNCCYIIKNRLQLLDRPGEWACIKSGSTCTVYYWPNNLDELNLTQARKLRPYVIKVVSAHDVFVQGLEVMGASGDNTNSSTNGMGIQIVNGTNVVIASNVIHDNGAFAWNGNYASPCGTGVWMDGSKSVTVSKNLIMMNTNGVSITSSTDCTVTQNEIAYDYIDGMDISGRVGAKPTTNLTFSNNYVHHHLNLTQHPDAFQPYDVGVQQMHVLNNALLGNCQIMLNGFGGDFQGNVIWNYKINSPGITGTGSLVFANNSLRYPLAIGTGSNGKMPTTVTENVLYGRLTIPYPTPVYTGDRNLVVPIAPDANAYCITPLWKGFTTATAFYAYTGQDKNSKTADPLVINMPTTMRELKDITLCTANTMSIYDNAGAPALGDFSVGDHIEINMDGVVRTITAIDTVYNTITFNIPLAGAPNIPRETVVEKWGLRTDYRRDCRLANGSPGLTMSASGGPVGSLINISDYRAGDFNGDGIRDIPAWPPDVPTSVDFYISNWFSYGN